MKFDVEVPLSSFVKVFKEFLPKPLCNDVVESLQTAEFEKHYFYSASNDSQITHYDDPLVSRDNIPQFEPLMVYVWNCIHNYIVKDFDLPYFRCWDGYSNVRFNKYDVNTKMMIHVDHIQSLFPGPRKGIPILSVVGLLNDDFEGGEFVFYDDDKLDFKQGDIVIFPSNFLYPHRVNPISKGTRYSFVSWVW